MSLSKERQAILKQKSDNYIATMETPGNGVAYSRVAKRLLEYSVTQTEKMMSSPLVYSYLRFSSAKQADGTSIARQTSYAKAWADRHGMSLDTTLSMADRGLSAYHGRHVEFGEFGAFLEAVKRGDVPKGSVLIVEGHDRLSRENVTKAQMQLLNLIHAGIRIVTAADDLEYSEESLRDRPELLMLSLVYMMRAHDESKRKAERVSEAIATRCEQWLAGTFSGRIIAGHDPDWLAWNGNGWTVLEARAEAIRRAIEMYISGHGAHKIFQKLDELGLRMFEQGNIDARFYKLLKFPSLMGDKLVHVAVKKEQLEYRLPSYYPALISKDQFLKVQTLLGRRSKKRHPGATEFPGILTGLGGLTVCGYCGSLMLANNSTRQRANGERYVQHRIMCGRSIPHASVSRSKTATRYCGVTNTAPIERGILTWCADQMNLSSLLSEGSNISPLETELNAMRVKLDELAKKIGRLVDAMLEAPASPALIKKLNELEIQQSELRQKSELLERDLHVLSATPAPAESTAWAEIIDGALAMDYDARMRARGLIHNTFSRIAIYQRGIDVSNTTIDVVLISKRGASRILSIDRKTGLAQARTDVLNVAALPPTPI